jgi:hypothetical protein
VNLSWTCNKKSAEKPKKSKPSPATIPNTQQVDAPSKPTPSTIPMKGKDAIQIDDEQGNISAKAPADDAFQRNDVARGTPSTHPHLFPTLRRAPLHRRCNEITNLMNEVWGNLENQKEDLEEFEDAFRTFFMKHKIIRQVNGSTSPHALGYVDSG